MLSYPFNIANVPAINVPCGFSGGLPMGFQVAAKPYGEEMLYKVAHAYEQEARCYEQHPNLEETLAGASEVAEPQNAPDNGAGGNNPVRDDIQALGRLVGLEIPDADTQEVGLRFDALVKAMAEIEADLGSKMDMVDPIPPVYPLAEY